MPKFAIVSKDDAVSIKVATTIQKQLITAGFVYNDKTPDLVIAIGGDGTFLSAVHKYINRLDKTSFASVHTGTLGFFADCTVKELKSFISSVTTTRPTLEQRKLMKVQVGDEIYYALNEIRIESIRTLSIDVLIDGKKMETFHGSGLCLSTQTGSTAYTRSLGGAVIQPGLELLELSEINGIHHNYYRSLNNSLILSGSTEVKFKMNNLNEAKLCFDRFSIDLNKDEITCALSDKKVRIAHYHPLDWMKNFEQLFS